MGGSSIKHKMERKKVLAFLRPLDRATNTSKVQTTSRRYKTQNAWYKFRNFSWEKKTRVEGCNSCLLVSPGRQVSALGATSVRREFYTDTQRKHTHTKDVFVSQTTTPSNLTRPPNASDQPCKDPNPLRNHLFTLKNHKPQQWLSSARDGKRWRLHTCMTSMMARGCCNKV